MADATNTNATGAHEFLDALKEMENKHIAGDIDFYLDAQRFAEPELQEAAKIVNAIVLSHFETKKNALDIVAEFARGNFDADIQKLPGKKAFINDILDNARDSFRATTTEIRRLCSAIESGDLRAKVDLSKVDGEYREVLSDFDKAFGALNQAFAAIAEQVEQVSSSITQMSTASKTLSSNSQITSASVEEVSASVAETDQQVRANAEASRRASDLVVNATRYTDQGSNKVREMVDSMHGIKSSSQDIAKIIKVIDEIAFQTNLLALNAAVEAARAGQHSRGFAVVAQEVRNLAGRSAKAARETSQLIDDATQRVNSGVLIADETREAFVGISEQISQVKDIVEEIDRSSAEQSRGVAQISLSMSEISNAASETSKQADELAAGSDEMTNATRQMKAEIDRYKLRSIETDSTSDILANLSPEMLAQLQQMVSAKPANGYANGASSKLLDQDARGYGSF